MSRISTQSKNHIFDHVIYYVTSLYIILNEFKNHSRQYRDRESMLKERSTKTLRTTQATYTYTLQLRGMKMIN